MKRNPFVVIESLDGAGGSTQLALLQKRLSKEGYNPHIFHFPQEDRATGQVVYEKYLRDKSSHAWSRREQALIYIQDFYSRNEDIESLLGEGKNNVVISDRYCTSTMAYQTIGTSGKKRKEILDWIMWLCWKGKPRLHKPDLVILLDIPPALALQRIQEKAKDRHERLSVLSAVRRSYMRLAKERKWTVVQSVEGAHERTRKEIHEEVWQQVAKLLP